MLTDEDADLAFPVPTIRHATTRRRLMLWYLEIAAAHLTSPAFDRDTIMLDSDQLVFEDLGAWFTPYTDLSIVARVLRPKDLPGFQILNGVQWWPVASARRLAAFYRVALEMAEGMTEAEIAWGADTVALERLLGPIDATCIGTIVDRGGVRCRLIAEEAMIERLSSVQIRHLAEGKTLTRHRPVLDFRNTRKPFMAATYEKLIGAVPRGTPEAVA